MGFKCSARAVVALSFPARGLDPGARIGRTAVTEKNVDDTIEFYVPHDGLDLRRYLAEELPEDATPKQHRLLKQAVHHLARYEWARQLLQATRPGVVLDVACGAGYGSFLLAEALPDHDVIGGDYDPRAVAHAADAYSRFNLEYRTIDAVTWRDLDRGQPVQDVDYVVSFDTLEHLLHRELMLINVAEALPEHGMLLLSTPCHTENRLFPEWEHHKIEYSCRYLYNLMGRFFERVLIPDDGTLPKLDFWTETVNKDRQRYLLRSNPIACLEPRKLGLDGESPGGSD
jgi:2-polyprenyl-3-methyl-5-hydroxy-6-metoxy-1,4-benzoquinol methylase